MFSEMRRRNALRLLMAAGAGPFLPAIGHAAGSETPKRGGTLVFGLPGGDPPSYDLHAGNIHVLIHLLAPHYNGLLKIDSANYPNVVGDLARDWTVSKDATVFTFHLTPGVKFHDGAPLTSEDVKATYERLRDPPPGIVSVRQALFVPIKSIETPDPLTVIFTLSAPSHSMLLVFANPFNAIYRAEKIRADPRFPQTNVLGTGPYRFVQHVEGSLWKGERFADYFKPGRPYLDGFQADLLSGAALTNAIQSGQVLNEFRGLAPSQRDILVKALGNQVEVFEEPWCACMVAAFNTRRAPFDDPRVRRALSLAVDRWAAQAALPKISTLAFAGGFLRPRYDLAATPDDLVKMPGFSRDIEASRAEARQLLKQAGQEKLRFKLHNRTITDPSQVAGIYLIDQWRRIGVEVEHLILNDATWSSNLASGDFDVTVDNQNDPVDEPDYQLARYQSYDLSANRGHYTDKQLDELFARQHDATDKAARYKLLRQFEQRMLSQAYVVPILWLDRIVVLRKVLHGWHMTPSPYVGQDLENVWLAS
jgi:peptide/nickel transport system substrate-binding protein